MSGISLTNYFDNLNDKNLSTSLDSRSVYIRNLIILLTGGGDVMPNYSSEIKCNKAVKTISIIEGLSEPEEKDRNPDQWSVSVSDEGFYNVKTNTKAWFYGQSEAKVIRNLLEWAEKRGAVLKTDHQKQYLKELIELVQSCDVVTGIKRHTF